MSKPENILAIFLLVAIAVSATLSVYFSHKTRGLYTKFYTLQLEEQKIQDDWGRLQIQEGYDSSLHGLAKKAYRELKMYEPPVTERIFLQ